MRRARRTSAVRDSTWAVTVISLLTGGDPMGRLTAADQPGINDGLPFTGRAPWDDVLRCPAASRSGTMILRLSVRVCLIGHLRHSQARLTEPGRPASWPTATTTRRAAEAHEGRPPQRGSRYRPESDRGPCRVISTERTSSGDRFIGVVLSDV